MFYKAQHDTCSIDVNKPFPSGLSGMSKLLIVHDVNNILDNKYTQTNISLILFAAVICCTNQIPPSLSDQEQSTLPAHPDLDWHQTTTISAAALYGTMTTTEEKPQLSSLTEISMKQMKHGHGETQEHGYFGESLTSEKPFVSLFQYRLFPVAIQGSSCLLCIISLNKHCLATYASCHCMSACLLSLKLLTAKNIEYAPHHSSCLYADFKNSQFRASSKRYRQRIKIKAS